ncbi:MAG: response regulator transcription factor [Anaerolineae bacterium]|nr:response regulator transcription factor [Anaerolineae bacterium]
MTASIRVFIVDDHRMLRMGVRVFLESCDDLELVGEAPDGETAIWQCAALRPDVVLMDQALPGMDGAAATEAILQENPDVRVIALTSYFEPRRVERALKAGAISYVLKDVDADELAHAIREAHAGRSVLSPEAAQALIQTTTRRSTPHYDFTAREQQVLELMVTGRTNAEIAAQLAISESTVKYHVSGILNRLGVTRRAEAIALALRDGLVPPAPPSAG